MWRKMERGGDGDSLANGDKGMYRRMKDIIFLCQYILRQYRQCGPNLLLE
jgi:hypothetical protein